MKELIAEVVPGIVHLDYGSDDNDNNLENYNSQVAFANEHREELFEIISNVPNFTSSPRSLENQYQRLYNFITFFLF